MYYLKTLQFTTHNGERIEIDENGDVTGYYDILNWQLGDNGEIAFVKVGEHIFTNSVWTRDEKECDNILEHWIIKG